MPVPKSQIAHSLIFEKNYFFGFIRIRVPYISMFLLREELWAVYRGSYWIMIEVYCCSRRLYDNTMYKFKESSCIPEVSADVPCRRPNMFPQALLMAAILAITGRLWMTKLTSFFCILDKFCAWPRRPNPVTSVAPCALYLCISLAAVNRGKNSFKLYQYNSRDTN